MPGLVSILSGIILFCSATIGAHAYASDYNSLLVRAQISIFPKIILLDEDIIDKISGNSIKLHVVYSHNDKKDAERVKQLIEEHYGNKIGKYDLTVRLVDARSIDAEVPTAFYLLNVADDVKQYISEFAISNQRISFSYNHKDLDEGTLISLQLKEKVYIYLSKKQLSTYGIRFQSVFYNIVKVIE